MDSCAAHKGMINRESRIRMCKASPTLLFWVRVLVPLPENQFRKRLVLFSMLSSIPHQSLIHFIKAITIQVNINIICDIHISVSQEARKYLHINAFVVAVGCECVAKYMLAPEFYPCFFTCLSRLVLETQRLFLLCVEFFLGDDTRVQQRFVFFQFICDRGRFLFGNRFNRLIYIRNDIFLESIHNKGVLKMIGSKYLSQLVNPSMLS